MAEPKTLSILAAVLFLGTAWSGCLQDDGGDAGADAYTLTATDVPNEVTAEEPFQFTLAIEGPEGESAHIGAHYGGTSTDEPSTQAYDQACNHQAGDLPGTFTVTCTIPSAGEYFLRGHLQIVEGGETTNFWTDEKAITVIGEAASPGVVVVGTDAAFPPFESYDPQTDEFSGFDIDLMREIADRGGFTVEFRNLGFDTLIEALKQGEIDAVISAMSITEERSQEVDFSIPYYEANQSVSLRAADAGKYASLEDMKGKGLKFGAQSGTVGADVVVDEFGESALVRYDTYPLAVAALKRGDVDAVVMDAPAQEEAAEGDDAIVVAFEFSVGDVYGIAVAKGNDALLTKINGALTEMYADGSLAALREQWEI